MVISPLDKFLPSFHGQHKCHLLSGVHWASPATSDGSFLPTPVAHGPLFLELGSPVFVLGGISSSLVPQISSICQWLPKLNLQPLTFSPKLTVTRLANRHLKHSIFDSEVLILTLHPHSQHLLLLAQLLLKTKNKESPLISLFFFYLSCNLSILFILPPKHTSAPSASISPGKH